jgi:hypothetical protein
MARTDLNTVTDPLRRRLVELLAGNGAHVDLDGAVDARRPVTTGEISR